MRQFSLVHNPIQICFRFWYSYINLNYKIFKFWILVSFVRCRNVFTKSVYVSLFKNFSFSLIFLWYVIILIHNIWQFIYVPVLRGQYHIYAYHIFQCPENCFYKYLISWILSETYFNVILWQKLFQGLFIKLRLFF